MLSRMITLSATGLAMAFLVAGCGTAVQPVTSAPPSSSSSPTSSKSTPAPSASSAHSSTAGSTSPSASPSSGQASTYVAKAGPFSITVPDNWTVGSQIKLQTTLAVGVNGFALLPNLAPTSGPGIVNNRLSQTHYFSEEINGLADGTVALQVSELGTAGQYYMFSVTVPESQQAQLQAAAKTLKTPPVATPTQIVQFMRAHAAAVHRGLSYATSQAGSQNQWVLIGGNPATAQEEFALFRTIDGGQQWKLADYTSFVGHNDFLGTVGVPSLLFWNANDGIIAESSSFGQTVGILYTTNGGTSWTAANVPQVGGPTGQKAPIITRNGKGTLDVTTTLFPNKTVTVQSTDNGKAWTAVAGAESGTAQPSAISYTRQTLAAIAKVGHGFGFSQDFIPTRGLGSTFQSVTGYHTTTTPPYPVMVLQYSNFRVQEVTTAQALYGGGDHTSKAVTLIIPGVGRVAGTWMLIYGHSTTPQLSVLQFPLKGMVVQMGASPVMTESQMIQIAESFRTSIAPA